MRRVSSVVAALFASACCSSLPRTPQRHVLPLPAVPDAYQVVESSRVWRDEKRRRDVPVKMYEPERARKALPVVVVSHGIGEDRDSYAYLGRALAAAGFLAVHITHAGTDREVRERGYLHLYRAVKRPENWIHRAFDVSFVLDRLEGDPRADAGRVAVAGHSAGAFTAFAVAGLRGPNGQILRDERVGVIVPMSMPRMDDVVPPGGYDGIELPVLNVTGTCDASLLYRTLPRHRRRPFEETRAGGHYLVTLRGVNHNTFSSGSDRHQALLAGITIAFLRGFLLGDPAAASWFNEPGLSVVDGTELTIERK
ncbi:MAG TPA: alpha/beta hydrolase [Thermoanaerobaculia bacterium]|nr:alpha/beta hydrolase [Thermoanaerobaculia bacterium]